MIKKRSITIILEDEEFDLLLKTRTFLKNLDDEMFLNHVMFKSDADKKILHEILELIVHIHDIQE